MSELEEQKKKIEEIGENINALLREYRREKAILLAMYPPEAFDLPAYEFSHQLHPDQATVPTGGKWYELKHRNSKGELV